MKSKTTQNICSILFLIVGGITVLEFLFIQGMFTSLIVMFAVFVLGIVNIILSLKNQQYVSALHYVLTSIALCMGYITLL